MHVFSRVMSNSYEIHSQFSFTPQKSKRFTRTAPLNKTKKSHLTESLHFVERQEVWCVPAPHAKVLPQIHRAETLLQKKPEGKQRDATKKHTFFRSFDRSNLTHRKYTHTFYTHIRSYYDSKSEEKR